MNDLEAKNPPLKCLTVSELRAYFICNTPTVDGIHYTVLTDFVTVFPQPQLFKEAPPKRPEWYASEISISDDLEPAKREEYNKYKIELKLWEAKQRVAQEIAKRMAFAEGMIQALQAAYK